MGRRGPKPRVAAASAAPSRPEPPAGLDAAAASAWESLCRDLDEAGTLARTDGALIALYARTASLAENTYRLLQAERATGELMYIRLCNAYNNQVTKLHRILLDCGLSPSTRKPASTTSSHPFALIADGDI